MNAFDQTDPACHIPTVFDLSSAPCTASSEYSQHFGCGLAFDGLVHVGKKV